MGAMANIASVVTSAGKDLTIKTESILKDNTVFM